MALSASQCYNCQTELLGNPRECPVCHFDQDRGRLSGSVSLELFDGGMRNEFERDGEHSGESDNEQPRAPLPLEQRTAILVWVIQEYTAMGFEIQSQTPTTAQLIHRKRFSCGMMVLWFFIGLLTIGAGWLIYLVLYTFKRDAISFLKVDEIGQVWVTEYGAYTRGGEPEPHLKYGAPGRAPVEKRLAYGDAPPDAPANEEAVEAIVVLPTEEALPRPDISEQLRKLAELRDEGLITSEEFEAKKRDVLDRI